MRSFPALAAFVACVLTIGHSAEAQPITGTNITGNVTITNTSGINGYAGPFVRMLGTGTAPSKTVLVAGGNLYILNDALNAYLWQMDDSGNVANAGSLSVNGILSPNTVTGGVFTGGNITGQNVTVDGASMTLAAWLASKADGVDGILTSPQFHGGSGDGSMSWLTSSPALDTRFAGGGLTNGVIVAAGGNQISYCPVLSCVTSPSTDHQRASALFWSTTSDDGHSEEQTVGIETIIGTGYAKDWTQSTAYSVGDNVEFNKSGRNEVYRATQAGTSASSGSGPTGTGSAIADGSVVWAWINAAAIDGKVGLYNEASVVPGAGNSWAQANNVMLQAGVTPSFNINTEFDFRNNADNCAPAPGGVGICNNLEITTVGLYQSTNVVHISSSNAGSVYAAGWGIHFEGALLASIAAIEDDTAAPIGLAFAYTTSGAQAHSVAAIVDESTGGGSYIVGGTKTGADFLDLSSSPYGFRNTGSHVNGTFIDSSNSPVSVALSGTHSFESIADNSTTGAAFNAAGTYSVAAISTQNATTTYSYLAKDNQRICFNGTDACFVHSAGKMYYQQGGTTLFTVADTTGNAVFKGTVTPSGTP